MNTYPQDVLNAYKAYCSRNRYTRMDFKSWEKVIGNRLFGNDGQKLGVCYIPIRGENFECPKVFAVHFKNKDWYEDLVKSISLVNGYNCTGVYDIEGNSIMGYSRSRINDYGVFFARYSDGSPKTIILPRKYNENTQNDINSYFKEFKKKMSDYLAKKFASIEDPHEMKKLVSEICEYVKEVSDNVMAEGLYVDNDCILKMSDISNSVMEMYNSIVLSDVMDEKSSLLRVKEVFRRFASDSMRTVPYDLKKRFKKFFHDGNDKSVNDINVRYNFYRQYLTEKLNSHIFNDYDKLLRSLMGEKIENIQMEDLKKQKKSKNHLEVFALL